MSAVQLIAEETRTTRVSGRAKGRPEVSVVLVSDDCWQTTQRSLDRVASRCHRMLAEVIVVHTGDENVPAALQRAHPEVRFCFAPEGTSEAQLRSIAILEASGDIVALRRTADVRDAVWLDAHYVAATGLQPDNFDEADLDLTEERIVAAEINVDGAPTSERRAHTGTRHSIETSPASSASSAA